MIEINKNIIGRVLSSLKMLKLTNLITYGKMDFVHAEP